MDTVAAPLEFFWYILHHRHRVSKRDKRGTCGQVVVLYFVPTHDWINFYLGLHERRIIIIIIINGRVLCGSLKLINRHPNVLAINYSWGASKASLSDEKDFDGHTQRTLSQRVDGNGRATRDNL